MTGPGACRVVSMPASRVLEGAGQGTPGRARAKEPGVPGRCVWATRSKPGAGQGVAPALGAGGQPGAPRVLPSCSWVLPTWGLQGIPGEPPAPHTPAHAQGLRCRRAMPQPGSERRRALEEPGSVDCGEIAQRQRPLRNRLSVPPPVLLAAHGPRWEGVPGDSGLAVGGWPRGRWGVCGGSDLPPVSPEAALLLRE